MQSWDIVILGLVMFLIVCVILVIYTTLQAFDDMLEEVRNYLPNGSLYNDQDAVDYDDPIYSEDDLFHPRTQYDEPILIGTMISHKFYGVGRVVGVFAAGHIVVSFNGKMMGFSYPQDFEDEPNHPSNQNFKIVGRSNEN